MKVSVRDLRVSPRRQRLRRLRVLARGAWVRRWYSPLRAQFRGAVSSPGAIWYTDPIEVRGYESFT